MLGAVRISPTLVHAAAAEGIGFGVTGLLVGEAVLLGVGTAPSLRTPRQVYDFPLIFTTWPSVVHNSLVVSAAAY